MSEEDNYLESLHTGINILYAIQCSRNFSLLSPLLAMLPYHAKLEKFDAAVASIL